MLFADQSSSARPWLLGAAVALLGIAGSVFLAWQQAESVVEVEKARFAQAANSLTEALARCIDIYTEIAFGLRGLFIVDPLVTRRGFVDAVTHLDVVHRHPEIRNIAFTRYVSAAERLAFEARVRADTSVEQRGYPDFAIHPPGERKEYFVADYLWPMDGNQGILGLDISAQPANLASMRHSMRSGEPVASAPFDLLQVATQRTGFVIRVPVFGGPRQVAAGVPLASNFMGSVAVTLRMHDLVLQLEREGRMQGLQMVITDRGSALAGQAGGANLPLVSTLSSQGVAAPGTLSRDLRVYSRLWHLEFHPATPFLSESERRAPIWIGVSGSLIALLLAALVTMLVRTRQAALVRADASREALQDSEGRWKFAIEGSGDALWDHNIAEGKVFFSPRWKEMLGLSGEEVGDRPDEWTRRVHPEDLEQAVAALRSHLDRDTPSYSSEYRMVCKDGSWKWVLDRGKVVLRDAAGNPLRVIGTLSDITGRKLTAQALQASLRDKEALLLEVHHRVKNNLQVITSLLRLEGRRTQPPQTRATLADMQGRIGSMALLHETLYRSGTFASIDLGDYLRRVAEEAFAAQRGPAMAVRLHASLATLQVGMDQALPCGLLVNELISNSLKHGFPDGHPGEVRITLQPAAGQWRLEIGDTGVGLPAAFRIEEQPSMGLQLVSQLCQQIGGALEIRSTPGEGASFGVVFGVEAPAPLVMPA